MSGESVEDRWNREFITIEQKKRAKEAAADKKAIETRKDVREPDVEQETRKSDPRKEKLLLDADEEAEAFKIREAETVKLICALEEKCQELS